MISILVFDQVQYSTSLSTARRATKNCSMWILYVLAGQAGVANAGYVQLAHLVMDSQK